MSPEDMRLTELAPAAQAYIKYHLEWVMDPPPFILDHFPDDLIQNIYRVKMQHLAKVAGLEADLIKARGAMFEDIAKVIPGRG